MFNVKKTAWLLIALLLIVPLALVACGDDDGDKDDNKKVELTETFESELGYTVKYPKGWSARDGDSGVEIVNQENFDTMDDESIEEVPEGAFALMIMDPIPADMMAMLGVAEDASMKDVLTTFGGMMASEGLSMGDVSEVKVGGKDAAKAPITEETGEGFMVGFKVDDTNLVFVVGAAHAGELDQFESVGLDIAGTISYTAPAAE